MTWTVWRTAIITLVLGAACAAVQTTNPALKPGDAAPEFRLPQVLQAPAGTTADLVSLKGKVVVLEFWATWCAPCMPGIDHLNELAEKFEGQPVVFIAITDEDEAVISRFVKNKPIRGWIGLNPTQDVFRAFGVQSRPHTTVIDRNGNIAAITMPKDLTAAAISDLLANKPISLPLKPRTEEDDIDWDQHWYTDGRDPVFQFIIKPVPPRAATPCKIGPNHFGADAQSLTSIVEWAYELPRRRIELRLPKSKQQYQVSFWVPRGREDVLHPMAQQAIEVGLGLKTHREPREMDALVLTLPKGQTLKLHSSAATQPMTQVWHGVLTARKQPLKVLATQLEEFGLSGGSVVVDESGMVDTYDWDIPYDHASDKVVLEGIREQLGLEPVKEKRKVEVLVVEAAEPK